MSLKNTKNLVRIVRNGIVYTGHRVQKKDYISVYALTTMNGKRLDAEHFMYVSNSVFPLGGPALANRKNAKERFKVVANNLMFDKDVSSARVVITEIQPQIKENVLPVSSIENYNMDHPYGGSKVYKAQIRNQTINRMRNEFMCENPYIRN